MNNLFMKYQIYLSIFKGHFLNTSYAYTQKEKICSCKNFFSVKIHNQTLPRARNLYIFEEHLWLLKNNFIKTNQIKYGIFPRARKNILKKHFTAILKEGLLTVLLPRSSALRNLQKRETEIENMSFSIKTGKFPI